MAGGFASGMLWGGVLSLGVAGVVSVLAPTPTPPDVADAAPGAVVQPEPMAGAGSGESSRADRTPITALPPVKAPAPEAETDIILDSGTTQTAAQPETGSAEGMTAPDIGADVAGVPPEGDDPVLPNPQALAPMEPAPAEELSISTEPAQPPTPVVPAPEEGAFDDAEEPAVAQTPQADATPAPAPDVSAVAPTVTAPEAGEDAALQSDLAIASAEPAEPLLMPLTPPPAILADRTPVETDEQSAELPAPEPADTPAPAAQAPDAQAVETAEPEVAEPVAPEIAEPDVPAPQPGADSDPTTGQAVEEATDATRPAIGTPAVSLTERSSTVRVNRLPSIGGADAEEVTETAEPATEDAPRTDLSDDPRPIIQHAEPFEQEGDKPLMAIILIDEGVSVADGASGLAALRSFPYPVSFAVEVSLPDAADRAALYRANGFEVLAMVDLPEGAAPSDAETTLGVTLNRLPEAIGVLEGTKGGLQGSRDVADQVTAILAQSGHGLITQDKGLNTMPKLARKSGVPAAPVFRDFDSKDQSARVIRRFLDQAAFKAGQEGAVVMVGRLRPDTISALLLWGLQDRAGDVSLAPASAVLLRE